jgi:hypothetical protein
MGIMSTVSAFQEPEEWWDDDTDPLFYDYDDDYPLTEEEDEE